MNNDSISGILKTLSSLDILSFIFIFYLYIVILVSANLLGGVLFLDNGLFLMLSGALYDT